MILLASSGSSRAPVSARTSRPIAWAAATRPGQDGAALPRRPLLVGHQLELREEGLDDRVAVALGHGRVHAVLESGRQAVHLGVGDRPALIEHEAADPCVRCPNGEFEFVSETVSGEHGPHPDLASDFELFCEVLVPELTWYR